MHFIFQQTRNSADGRDSATCKLLYAAKVQNSHIFPGLLQHAGSQDIY